jgi:hypothetical protein
MSKVVDAPVKKLPSPSVACEAIMDGEDKTAHWKALLRLGFPPEFWFGKYGRWWPEYLEEDRRLLLALGVGGELVRLLNGRKLTARGNLASRECPYPPPVAGAFIRIVNYAVRYAESWDHVSVALQEAALFASCGWKLYDCEAGHIFVASPRRRVACPAHRLAVIQARHRRKRKLASGQGKEVTRV